MSQAGVDYSALAAQNGAIGSMPAPARPPVGPSGKGPVDYHALALQNGALDVGGIGSGLATGDTGYTLVVPKEGESFQDTLNRAVTRWKSLTPEEQQAELRKAQTGMGKKTAEVMGGAAAIGVAGPAGLAIPGEIGGAISAGAQAAIPHVLALGQWAEANPITAKILLEGIKATGYGAALYNILKRATR